MFELLVTVTKLKQAKRALLKFERNETVMEGYKENMEFYLGDNSVMAVQINFKAQK